VNIQREVLKWMQVATLNRGWWPLFNTPWKTLVRPLFKLLSGITKNILKHVRAVIWVDSLQRRAHIHANERFSISHGVSASLSPTLPSFLLSLHTVYSRTLALHRLRYRANNTARVSMQGRYIRYAYCQSQASILVPIVFQEDPLGINS